MIYIRFQMIGIEKPCPIFSGYCSNDKIHRCWQQQNTNLYNPKHLCTKRTVSRERESLKNVPTQIFGCHTLDSAAFSSMALSLAVVGTTYDHISSCSGSTERGRVARDKGKNIATCLQFIGHEESGGTCGFIRRKDHQGHDQVSRPL